MIATLQPLGSLAKWVEGGDASRGPNIWFWRSAPWNTHQLYPNFVHLHPNVWFSV